MDRRTGTLIAAILGSGVVFLDSTVVNVALPRIGQDLHSPAIGVLEGQSYVYNAYLLSLSAMLILAGALADAYGRRRVFVLGLAGFGIASLMCGLAPTLETLIAFRVIQGAAGALLVPGSLAILTAAFEGPALGRVLGIWAGASGASTILGPLVGGILVQTISWRAAFLINLPLIAIALWMTWRSVDESRDPAAGRTFDWGGALLVAVAVGGLSFGAIYGGQHAWQGWLGQASLVVGVVATAWGLAHMARGRTPLIPLAMFRVRNFAMTNLETFLVYGALYVFLYLVTIFAQGTLGYSAAAAGLLAIPGTLLLTFISPTMGGLAARHGPRRFMAAGPAIMALGVAWLIRLPVDSPAWVLAPGDPSSWIPPLGVVVDFLPTMLLFGLGLSILVAPLTTALMTSVPEPKAGIASAVNNAISRVGPQLAGAAMFVLVTIVFFAALGGLVPGQDMSSAAARAAYAPFNPPPTSAGPDLVAAVRESSTTAFRFAMAMGAALLVAGAVVGAAGIRDRPAAEAISDRAVAEA
jgi:EmrB/QacA subfamily drug resistance transporter